MPTNPPTLAWPTAGERISLAESITSLVENARTYGHSPSVFIASDNTALPDTGLAPEVLQSLDEAKAKQGISYTLSTIATRKQAIAECAGSYDTKLLEYALLPKQGEPGYGVNYTTCLLYGAGGHLISSDDDVISYPARSIKRIESSKEQDSSISILKNPPLTQTFNNSDVLYFANRNAVLGAVSRVEQDIIGGYLSLLQRFDAGRVLLVNPGLYGESGTGSARGALTLDGISRRHLMDVGYQDVRCSREAVNIPDTTCMSTSVHFMAGQFAADATVPIAPFIPYGRNSDGLASLITRIMHPEGLNGFMDFGLYHAPPERSKARDIPNLHPLLALTNYRPGFPDMVMALVLGIAPDMSVVGAENRLQYLGRQLCGVASLSATDFVDIFYAAWSYQFNQVIEELERLLDVYGREPSAWAQDVDAHIDSLNFYMREPVALFGLGGAGAGGARDADSGAQVGCGLSIDEARRHLDLYGGLLEIWCDLWENSALLAKS